MNALTCDDMILWWLDNVIRITHLSNEVVCLVVAFSHPFQMAFAFPGIISTVLASNANIIVALQQGQIWEATIPEALSPDRLQNEVRWRQINKENPVSRSFFMFLSIEGMKQHSPFVSLLAFEGFATLVSGAHKGSKPATVLPGGPPSWLIVQRGLSRTVVNTICLSPCLSTAPFSWHEVCSARVLSSCASFTFDGESSPCAVPPSLLAALLGPPCMEARAALVVGTVRGELWSAELPAPTGPSALRPNAASAGSFWNLLGAPLAGTDSRSSEAILGMATVCVPRWADGARCKTTGTARADGTPGERVMRWVWALCAVGSRGTISMGFDEGSLESPEGGSINPVADARWWDRSGEDSEAEEGWKDTRGQADERRSSVARERDGDDDLLTEHPLGAQFSPTSPRGGPPPVALAPPRVLTATPICTVTTAAVATPRGARTLVWGRPFSLARSSTAHSAPLSVKVSDDPAAAEPLSGWAFGQLIPSILKRAAVAIVSPSSTCCRLAPDTLFTLTRAGPVACPLFPLSRTLVELSAARAGEMTPAAGRHHSEGGDGVLHQWWAGVAATDDKSAALRPWLNEDEKDNAGWLAVLLTSDAGASSPLSAQRVPPPTPETRNANAVAVAFCAASAAHHRIGGDRERPVLVVRDATGRLTTYGLPGTFRSPCMIVRPILCTC